VVIGRIDLARQGAQRVLGDLEYRILEILWQGPAWTAREVQERLSPPRNINTVMTTLTRLVHKHLAQRLPEFPARFTAGLSRAALEEAVRAAVGRVFFDEVRQYGVPHFLSPNLPLDPDTRRELAEFARQLAEGPVSDHDGR
jgi:predicted transcriptional regulator